ncbi:hypothetical protein A1O1_08181 [Capronia coronata CBS 617.96]|uniref:Pre-mRNA splicing factor CLF1 n=1 Tax=Capronia coronata CBS 617.96 TaxID=1182541 RepID=W9XNI0_9EURO|nr:uncharacterized protein A1O1_08181 [Capronia coronata CBS 617.96]EXJ82112.1 hypothetical protein A1O1_08181 [Capronia coronata CBS 617.96]
MSAPKPPIALKNHCSIIHNGIVYVYSPEAFQSLELKEGREWKEESNGVSVTGAVCVKGGVDGDNSRPALYVVGGAANASSSNYPGLQRYSILDKSWATITPVVPVTQHRQNHGAAYLNASSSLLVYGGSQDGYTGPSSETFLLEMFPPYRVLAYSSIAPPTVKPFVLPWTEDRALMVGGSTTNVNIFTFGPSDGWQDLGLSLPASLPDPSVAQCALLSLDDNSKILQTFDLGQSPPTVTSDVLLNPGGLPAAYNETVGGLVSTASSTATPNSSSRSKRAIYLNSYPTYNSSLGPSTKRTGFDLAQDNDGLVAFIGGNDNDPLVFFNQTANSWVPPTQLLGTQEIPSTTPSSRQPSASASATSTSIAAKSGSSNKTRWPTILGAVLGSICGVAAILIILLLWMRAVRKKRARKEKQTEYADGKRRSGEYPHEENGLHPLSKAGQPMGRSPVPSTVITEADSTAMFGGRPDPKHLIRRVSSDRALPGSRASSMGLGQSLFKREREKGSLTISKPMMPDLGDYEERPSIELGKATPAYLVAAKPAPARKASQRKTNDGWGSYFHGEPVPESRTTFFSRGSGGTNLTKSEFWPGSGVPESSTRSPKIILRDSAGNRLEAQSVAAGSPSLKHGPPHSQSRGFQAQVSRATSVATTDTNDDNEYEDEQYEGAFSSGVPASVHDTAWTPVGNTWSGPAQRPLNPPSSYLAAQEAADPLPTSASNETSDSSGTQNSSIPPFPMPNSIRSIQPSGGRRPSIGPDTRQDEAGDYFSHVRVRSRTPDNTDMSWINLGTQAR